MKTVFNLLMGALVVSAVSVANAECRDDMAYEQLIDCIVVEGAGQSWESYQQEQAEISLTVAEPSKTTHLAQSDSK